LLFLQEAGSQGGYLLEHLLLESIGADRGGGIFAWTSSSGAQVLIEDPTFQEFLKFGDFRLFVGTDMVTDTSAVTTLNRLITSNPRLNVRAFLNPGAELFHPKMTWFEHSNHLSLVIGSGNLTMGGLRSNWEAFTVLHLKGKDAISVLQTIEEFLTKNARTLVPIDDPRVLELVQNNTGNERSTRGKDTPTPQEPEIFFAAEAVLVAEIPKSGNRWSQANFTREIYEEFFGAKVGSQRRIILQNVDDRGVAGSFESRPSVEVISENYRFEIAAAAGIDYPPNGRPVGVFLRLSTGHFWYSLLLPGESDYSTLEKFLTSKWQGPNRQVRRVQCSPAELWEAWPQSPMWMMTMPAL